MAAIRRGSHRFVFVASLALCCGGIFAAYSEAKSYLSGGATPQESFAVLAAGEPVAGLSVASSHLLLDNCYEAMTGVYGRLQPRRHRDAVAATCRAQADATAASMPSYSYAWYIGALASAALGDAPGMADRLRRSQQTGPTEQWIAELRVGLAEDHRDSLPDDVRGLNDGDLALLVTSYRGVATIAQRYVDNPGFRERITTIVEQLPKDKQRLFVDYVGAAANRSGQLP